MLSGWAYGNFVDVTTRRCFFCSTEVGLAFGDHIDTSHFDAETGAYLPERIAACTACRPLVASAPRQARQARRQIAYDMGGLAALGGFGKGSRRPR